MAGPPGPDGPLRPSPTVGGKLLAAGCLAALLVLLAAAPAVWPLCLPLRVPLRDGPRLTAAHPLRPGLGSHPNPATPPPRFGGPGGPLRRASPSRLPGIAGDVPPQLQRAMARGAVGACVLGLAAAVVSRGRRRAGVCQQWIDGTPSMLQPLEAGTPWAAAPVAGERDVGGVGLGEALAEVDALLGAGQQAAAVARVQRLAEDGALRGFGQAQCIPKRDYSLADLKLNRIDGEGLLSPKDRTLNDVQTKLQLLFAGVTALVIYQTHPSATQLLGVALLLMGLLTADQVANGGGGQALFLDTVGRRLNRQYAERVAKHEAGHFLIAYLLGILPEAYTLSSLDAYRRYRALNVQAGTRFCDAAFQQEVATGRITSSSLDRFVCVALAGVAVEYLEYGQAEGGLSDIQQLDQMLLALRFSEKKASSQVRWAAINTVSLLRRHKEVHDRLAGAMQDGRSVGECIGLIEAGLRTAELI